MSEMSLNESVISVMSETWYLWRLADIVMPFFAGVSSVDALPLGGDLRGLPGHQPEGEAEGAEPGGRQWGGGRCLPQRHQEPPQERQGHFWQGDGRSSLVNRFMSGYTTSYIDAEPKLFVKAPAPVVISFRLRNRLWLQLGTVNNFFIGKSYTLYYGKKW